MQQTVSSMSQREVYNPSAFTRFLWWLSTAEERLIKNCEVDRNRYAITGMAVLGTWMFATLAWSYFFYTVVNNGFEAVALGIFMGLIILIIDRALIKGINSTNKTRFGPIAFRLVLALTIGTFMAQPALLYLFDKEIKVQTSLDNEKRRLQKNQEQDTLYTAQISTLSNEKALYKKQLDEKYIEVTSARNAFIAETDGTGGSGKIGLKDIAKAKQNEYDKLNAEYIQLQQNLSPGVARADSALAAIALAKLNGQKAFDALLNDGFLTRIEALHNLIKDNSAAQFRYYLLVIILVLIELMPVIAKSLLPNGTYDEKVKLQEALERKIANDNMEHELLIKQLYNKLAHEQDAGFIQQFFSEAQQPRNEKMKLAIQKWQQNGHTFDEMWQKISAEMLTRQEG